MSDTRRLTIPAAAQSTGSDSPPAADTTSAETIVVPTTRRRHPRHAARPRSSDVTTAIVIAVALQVLMALNAIGHDWQRGVFVLTVLSACALLHERWRPSAATSSPTFRAFIQWDRAVAISILVFVVGSLADPAFRFFGAHPGLAQQFALQVIALIVVATAALRLVAICLPAVTIRRPFA